MAVRGCHLTLVPYRQALNSPTWDLYQLLPFLHVELPIELGQLALRFKSWKGPGSNLPIRRGQYHSGDVRQQSVSDNTCQESPLSLLSFFVSRRRCPPFLFNLILKHLYGVKQRCLRSFSLNWSSSGRCLSLPIRPMYVGSSI